MPVQVFYWPNFTAVKEALLTLLRVHTEHIMRLPANGGVSKLINRSMFRDVLPTTAIIKRLLYSMLLSLHISLIINDVKNMSD